MSTYHSMWDKIKELTLSETNDWINAVQPARGNGIDFRGVRVCDSDVLEALRNYKEDLESIARMSDRKVTT